jgi:hypothetical protein
MVVSKPSRLPIGWFLWLVSGPAGFGSHAVKAARGGWSTTQSSDGLARLRVHRALSPGDTQEAPQWRPSSATTNVWQADRSLRPRNSCLRCGPPAGPIASKPLEGEGHPGGAKVMPPAERCRRRSGEPEVMTVRLPLFTPATTASMPSTQRSHSRRVLNGDRRRASARCIARACAGEKLGHT